MHRRFLPIIALLFVAQSALSLSVFHVGNSVTDQSYGIVDIAIAKGNTHTFGRHMIPGAPLEWLWDHRCEGNREPRAYGECANDILANYSWDAVVLQPFVRSLLSDIEHGGFYMTEIYKGNANAQVYVLAYYPVLGDGDFITNWEKTPVYNKGQAFFEALANGLSAKFLNRKPVRIVPTGHVMYEIAKMFRDGKPVPGLPSFKDLYADNVHLSNYGKYIEAVTHFTAIYGQDPHDAPISGLRYWEGPYSVNAQFAELVWDLTWNLVQTYSYSLIGTTSATTPAPGSPFITTSQKPLAPSTNTWSIDGRLWQNSAHTPHILFNGSLGNLQKSAGTIRIRPAKKDR